MGLHDARRWMRYSRAQRWQIQGRRLGPVLCTARAEDAGDAAYVPLRAFLKSAPALNFGALLAAIWMRSPVCGFTPCRAPRSATENLPKPVKLTSPPRLSVSLTTSMNASTALLASAFASPASDATRSTNSALVTTLSSFGIPEGPNVTTEADTRRAGGPSGPEKALFATFCAALPVGLGLVSPRRLDQVEHPLGRVEHVIEAARRGLDEAREARLVVDKDARLAVAPSAAHHGGGAFGQARRAPDRTPTALPHPGSSESTERMSQRTSEESDPLAATAASAHGPRRTTYTAPLGNWTSSSSGGPAGAARSAASISSLASSTSSEGAPARPAASPFPSNRIAARTSVESSSSRAGVSAGVSTSGVTRSAP